MDVIKQATTVTPPTGESTIECQVCKSPIANRVEHKPSGITARINGVDLDSWVSWYCDFRDQAWHLQAEMLIQEANSIPSARIEAVLRDEARQIIKERQCTKSLPPRF